MHFMWNDTPFCRGGESVRHRARGCGSPGPSPTPESSKGSPKVIFPWSQWFSKVKSVSWHAVEWIYHLQHSGVVCSHRSIWMSRKWRLRVFTLFWPLILSFVKFKSADPRDLPVSSKICYCLLLHNQFFKGSSLQAKNGLQEKWEWLFQCSTC